MSEQVSQELLKVMNEIAENEATAAKIDASIFIRNNEKIINEKVAYLFNMIRVEAKNCNQKQDNYLDDINLMITHYKQKLNMVYDELYCQYANLQNEIQEARMNHRIATINYQKLVNNIENENPSQKHVIKKEEIKNKSKIYQNIINMCNEKFITNQEKFEKMINEEFLIASKSLQIVSEQNIFQKLFSKFDNIFHGGKKYSEILKQYNRMINNIDSQEIVDEMRNDTVKFVADILQKRGFDENGLEENAG